MLRSILSVLTAGLLLAGGSVASAQEPTSKSQTSSRVQNANATARVRCDAFHNKWERQFGSTGTLAQCRRMAADAISFDEKINQGTSILQKYTPSIEKRMRDSMRRNILNEQEWLKSMTQSLKEFQSELIKETVELYVEAGFDRAKVEAHFKAYEIDCGVWAPAFDRVVSRAKNLALQDWGRFGAVSAGSTLLTDAAFDVSRRNGNWNAEEGGFVDLFARFATGVVVEAVADHVTDPTDRIAKELQKEFAKARDSVLHGNNGLKWLATRLTEIHIDVRNRDFGVTKKGGK